MASAERIALLVCGLCLGSAAAAAEEPDGPQDPESDLLEYLGMWEETDEEWLMYDGILTVEVEEQQESESPREDDDSPEKEDES